MAISSPAGRGFSARSAASRSYALWTMTTAVVETTVVTEAAVSGDEEAFAAWWALAEGKGNGFAFLALAVAVIAGREARDPAGATPAWAASIAVLAGVGSFAGWALGMWLGIGIGNLLWAGSSIVMTLWTLWFGVALLRIRDATATEDATVGPRPAARRVSEGGPGRVASPPPCAARSGGRGGRPGGPESACRSHELQTP